MIAGTRVALGAGIGFLLADKLSSEQHGPYINHKTTPLNTPRTELKKIKKRIRHVAKRHGVEISDE